MNNKGWLVAILPGIFILVILAFIFALFLIKILWAWTIPDLFPGAVVQGLIARSISWITAFKLAIFVAVLAGVTGISKRSH